MEAPLAWNTKNVVVVGEVKYKCDQNERKCENVRDGKINLIGKKVEDPRIHLCEKCNFPILVYGRMIPCKHVFCFDCAKTTEKVCLRCGENVSRIEQSMQGHIFMCDFGYPKHSHQGCRRTYLSQRDLQAHINHRHVKQASKGQPSKERRLSDPRTEPRGERPERRADPNRPDPRLEARTSTYQQVQNYTVGSSAQASSADYGITQAQPSGVPPPSGMVPTQPGMVPPQPGMVPPQPGMVPPQTQMVPPQAQMVPPQPRMVAPPGMVPPSSAMVQPPPGMVEPPTSSQEEYHVPVRNTNLITVPLQDSGGDYQAPVQYPSSTAPAQGPYPGPVPAEHQAVRPQMGYPPHAGAIMTPQPGSGAVYTSPGGAMAPPGGPYIGGPQAGPHYDQPPHPPPASYGQPTSTTYSAPVSGAWTAPTQSLPGPAPDGPRPPHPPMPDSTSYTEGSYY